MVADDSNDGRVVRLAVIEGVACDDSSGACMFSMPIVNCVQVVTDELSAAVGLCYTLSFGGCGVQWLNLSTQQVVPLPHVDAAAWGVACSWGNFVYVLSKECSLASVACGHCPLMKYDCGDGDSGPWQQLPAFTGCCRNHIEVCVGGRHLVSVAPFSGAVSVHCAQSGQMLVTLAADVQIPRGMDAPVFSLSCAVGLSSVVVGGNFDCFVLNHCAVGALQGYNVCNGCSIKCAWRKEGKEPACIVGGSRLLMVCRDRTMWDVTFKVQRKQTNTAELWSRHESG